MTQSHLECPLVSVVINVDDDQFLDWGIRSVLNQSYPNLEVIIFDRSCSNLSKVIVEKYRTHERVKRIFYNPRDKDIRTRWGTCLSVIQGEYCWITRGCDFADFRFISQALLHATPGINLVYTKPTFVDALGLEVKPANPRNGFGSYTDYDISFENDYIVTGIDEFVRHLVHGNTVTVTSAVLFRTSVLESTINKLRKPNLYYDWMIFCIGCLLSKTISFISEPLIFVRQVQAHGENNTRIANVSEKLRDRVIAAEIFDRIIVSLDLNHEIRQINAREKRNHATQIILAALPQIGIRRSIILLLMYSPTRLIHKEVLTTIFKTVVSTNHSNTLELL